MATQFDNAAFMADLAECFRQGCGFPPPQQATILVEPEVMGNGYRVWVGQGFFDVDYHQAERIVKTKDASGGLRYTPATHPALAGWVTMDILASRLLGIAPWVNSRVALLERFWPGFQEEVRRQGGAVKLTEEQRTVLGLLAMKTIEERIDACKGLTAFNP